MTAVRDQRLLHSAAEYFLLDIVLCLWINLFRCWGGTIILRNAGNNSPNYTRNIPEELNFMLVQFSQTKKKKLNAFEKDPL
jgi:hypothetical protein